MANMEFKFPVQIGSEFNNFDGNRKLVTLDIGCMGRRQKYHTVFPLRNFGNN
jgi:hypothetical protein